MSKAAHNSCQAGADIPTGLGMRQKSTFAMSRLRHKRAVGKILPRNSGICLVGKIFSQNDEPLIPPQTVQLQPERRGWLTAGRFMD